MNPIRSCIACRKKDIKQNLIRIVKNKDGKFLLDMTQKQSARAVYICNNVHCLEKCRTLIEKNKIKIDEKSSILDIISTLQEKLEE